MKKNLPIWLPNRPKNLVGLIYGIIFEVRLLINSSFVLIKYFINWILAPFTQKLVIWSYFPNTLAKHQESLSIFEFLLYVWQSFWLISTKSRPFTPYLRVVDVFSGLFTSSSRIFPCNPFVSSKNFTHPKFFQNNPHQFPNWTTTLALLAPACRCCGPLHKFDFLVFVALLKTTIECETPSFASKDQDNQWK